MPTALKEKQDSTNNVTGLFIKQITMKENKAMIKLLDENDFKVQDINFNVKDEVTGEFKELWNSALQIVVEINPQLKKELPALKLNHIQFYYDKSGFLSDASFSVIWTFDDNGHVLNLNYSKFPIYKPEMSENTVAISGKHEELLHEIIKKAKAYMNGDTRTKQMSLIVDNTK
jgi:hypothetical protein